ncbi:hypothetical protein B0A52_01067 [Exophiala mesophila]|uniref:SnoaL-like domain-containing protein n=1 Tax=Exophiala mesophila TaxID=212818 RepID=A0A438NGD7_EXOME|nr:hypothetical protein B0A52_01067 [Exophiala mesophila]
MSYTIAEVKWPSTVKIGPSVKQLIQRALSLLDDTTSEAGQRMVDEVYTDDATVVFSSGEHRGREEILHCRDNVWRVVHSRRHIFEKVYAHNDTDRDLMAFGRVEVGLRNGKDIIAPFSAHILVDPESVAADPPRLREFRGYVDTSPILLALQSAA